MSLRLPSQAAETFAHRRTALATVLDGAPALLASGGLRPRNYPGNPYRFRVDSHFLYLTGASIPDAVLWLEGRAATLFMQPASAADALWLGPQPSWQEIAAATGVQGIRPLAELPEVMAAANLATVATIPSQTPSTRTQQAEWLGREWTGADRLEGVDARLADGLIDLRLRHDAAAIEQLRRASVGTVAAHRAGMAATRAGGFEYEVRAAMEAELMRRGMGTSYGSIVSVHGEVLHNETYDNELRDGDLLLADVGAECEGWAGDVTRTWPVSGRFSATQKTIYELVLAAEVAAIEAVKPGARYRDVHLTACRVLARGLVDEGILSGEVDGLVERGAHAMLFPHGVGHLLGLDVHDMEDLGDRAGYAAGRERNAQFGLSYLRLDRDLEAGMAVTIEPGFYQVPAILDDPQLGGALVADGTLNREALERFSDVRGIRIEDDVLVTETGHEVLTAEMPKQPAEVEALVGSGATGS